MGCRRILSLRVTTTNWCCPCCRGFLTRWILPSTCVRWCPTRASTPCSWRRSPNSSHCCWHTQESLMTVRSLCFFMNHVLLLHVQLCFSVSCLVQSMAGKNNDLCWCVSALGSFSAVFGMDWREKTSRDFAKVRSTCQDHVIYEIYENFACVYLNCKPCFALSFTLSLSLSFPPVCVFLVLEGYCWRQWSKRSHLRQELHTTRWVDTRSLIHYALHFLCCGDGTVAGMVSQCFSFI